MATEYVTNVVTSPHNIWTLTKHLAGSVNKAAAKTDATVYGTQTQVVVKEKPADHPILTVLGVILGVVIFVVIFIGYISGNIKSRDIIGI